MSDTTGTTVQQDPSLEVHHHRDDYGQKMGMWLFLFTEVLLFGGLFLLYMAYRIEYLQDFVMAAKTLKIPMGALNTIVLLTSSLTMVLSIVAIQRGKKWLSVTFLSTTIGFAVMFLVIKYFEWSAKYEHGIFPLQEELQNLPNGEIIFYGLYYAMTGLHAIHIIIGMVILSIMLRKVVKGSINKDKYVLLENGGLYWHLVDLIWIFLFPLLYLLH